MSDPKQKTHYRLYCVVSKEAIDLMKGNRGKMLAQGGHAFVHSWWASFFSLRHLWAALAYKLSPHAYKIALVVPTEADLLRLQEAYEGVCGTSLVKDAGFTVFEKPTVTCLGLGPIRTDRIGADLKGLKLFV